MCQKKGALQFPAALRLHTAPHFLALGPWRPRDKVELERGQLLRTGTVSRGLLFSGEAVKCIKFRTLSVHS